MHVYTHYRSRISIRSSSSSSSSSSRRSSNSSLKGGGSGSRVSGKSCADNSNE